MPFGLSRSFWLMLAAIVLVTAGAIVLPRVYRVALLGSGYMAQTLCAGVFVSDRSMDDLMAEDLSGPGLELLGLFQPTLDRDAETVSASAYGIAAQTAIHRDGLGCTLLHGAEEKGLRAQAAELFPAPAPRTDAEWPAGDQVTALPLPAKVDGAGLAKAIDAIFAEPDPTHPRNTRALVVVHGGRIVAERYAPGFDVDTPLIGWSMSKIATNALVGMRVKDGALALHDDALMPEWRGKNDPRRAITLNELMRMTSGLVFDESHDNFLSDVAQMLFVQGNGAAFAASKPLAHPPGTHFSYSSGTTNIIAGVLRETFADERDYLRFPRERLFEPLDMRSAVLEPDASGTFIGTRSSMPRRGTGRDSASSSCTTACGRESGFCLKAGSPIRSSQRSNPRRMNTARKSGSSFPSRRSWASHQCRKIPTTCSAITNRWWQSCPRTISSSCGSGSRGRAAIGTMRETSRR
jgi:CubicO group peptidase (beta-lactamase class C family)